MEEKDALTNILEHLTKLARADGKITEEEEELLTHTQISLMMYDEALEEALEDGIIDDDERDLLNGLKEQIVQGAWDTASNSDGISEDELKLLEILIKKVKN